MTYNIEELVQLYSRLIENIEQLNLPAKEQIEKLKGFVVADEIASDYSDIGLAYAKILVENEWITEEQYEKMKVIDFYFEKMSGNTDLWTNEALRKSAEWEECRDLAKRLLKDLGIQK